MTNRQTLGYALVAGGVLGSLFAFVFTAQQVFTEIYQLGHYFPLAFAGVAVGTAIAGFVNSRFVGRLGMRVISHAALIGYVVIAATMLVGGKAADAAAAAVHGALGIDDVCLRADDLELHRARHGAAGPYRRHRRRRCTARSPPCSASASAPAIGQDYDGTLVPFATGFFLCTLAALAVVLVVEKGRLFQPHGMKV